MSEIKSIWDGWEKQCFFRGTDGQGGYCARGFVWQDCVSVGDAWSAEMRVGRYIQQHYDLPESHVHEENSSFVMRPREIPEHAVVYANNNLRLTPDDFRRIDRESQIAEGMAAVETLVNTVPEAVYESK